MRHILILTTLLWAASVAAGPAEVAPRLTLEEAVGMALANSHRLAAAEAQVDGAHGGVAAARAATLPAVALSEEWLRTTNPTLAFSGKLGQEAFTTADFDPARLNEPDPFSNTRSRLTVSQLLWGGGRVRHALAAARYRRDAAVAGRERTRQEVVGGVVDAYVAAVVARERLAVAEASRETVEEHLGMVRDLFAGGLVVESDVLRLEVRQSAATEDVIRARSEVAITEAELDLAMGVEQERRWTLAGLPDPQALDTGLEELLERALERRPDLRRARLEVEVQGEARGMARSTYRPQARLQGALEANSANVSGIDGSNWTVSVGVAVPLFDGFAARARVVQAEAAQSAARHRQELLAESVALEVRRAYYALEAARQRSESAARAVSLARRSLTIVEDRYRNGLATLVDLLEAQSARSEAEMREVAARGEVLTARSALDLATGDLAPATEEG